MCKIGILSLAIACLLAGGANANFTAYNDCVWTTGQYISPNATDFLMRISWLMLPRKRLMQHRKPIQVCLLLLEIGQINLQ